MSNLLGTLIQKRVGDRTKLVDADWVNGSFMVAGSLVSETWNTKRFASVADKKYVDTSLGGAFVCNPKTQFTPYSDIRRKGRRQHTRDSVSIHSNSYDTGLGQYYAEAFEQHQQVLMLEFGVAKFTSLFSFFVEAVDQPILSQAKYGVTGDKAYQFGKFIGTIFGIAKVKHFAKIAPIIFLGKAGYYAIFGDPTAKYYTMKPTMHVYWNAVNSLLTNMAGEIGIANFTLKKHKEFKIGAESSIPKSEIARINELYGDTLFNERGYIDIRQIVGRAQAIANKEMEAQRILSTKTQISRQEWEQYINGDVTIPKKDTYEEFTNKVIAGTNLYRNIGSAIFTTVMNASIDGITAASDYIDDGKMNNSSTNGQGSKIKPDKRDESGDLIDWGRESIAKIKKYSDDVTTYVEAASQGGSRYASFAVEYGGSTSVSFQNDIQDIPLQGAMNSVGGAMHNFQFTTAGGNLVGTGVKAAMMAVGDTLQGALSGLTMGFSNVLLAMLGGGYIEMPKMWKDSNMTAQEFTFKMRLSSPYNHPIARLHKQFVPMMMILAGGLPLETGKSSYTSPFLCSAFLRGLVNIDLGMITHISINSAVGNVGRDDLGHSLAYDVEWKIVDFTTLLSAPVSADPFSLANSANSGASAFGRFMNTLASRDIYSSKYLMHKAGLRMYQARSSIERMQDPAYIGTMMGDIISPVAGLFVDETSLKLMKGEITIEEAQSGKTDSGFGLGDLLNI